MRRRSKSTEKWLKIKLLNIVQLTCNPPDFRWAFRSRPLSLPIRKGQTPERLISFPPEMALFRNLGVNLRVSLCDLPQYVSQPTLDFLNLAKNRSFPARKPPRPHTDFPDGH
jgi:hypothetical protein